MNGGTDAFSRINNTECALALWVTRCETEIILPCFRHKTKQGVCVRKHQFNIKIKDIGVKVRAFVERTARSTIAFGNRTAHTNTQPV